MNHPTDTIDVLNESGNPTGEVLSKKEIHALGKLHRAIHLYIFDKENRLLLQRRSAYTDYYPKRLSISVTGHVDAGEESKVAVQRELKEELGVDVDATHIEFLFSLRQEVTLSPTYIDRQFNDVYACWFNAEVPTMNLDPNEVSEVLWVPFAVFTTMVQDSTSELVPVYQEECARLVAWLNEHKTS